MLGAFGGAKLTKATPPLLLMKSLVQLKAIYYINGKLLFSNL